MALLSNTPIIKLDSVILKKCAIYKDKLDLSPSNWVMYLSDPEITTDYKTYKEYEADAELVMSKLYHIWMNESIYIPKNTYNRYTNFPKFTYNEIRRLQIKCGVHAASLFRGQELIRSYNQTNIWAKMVVLPFHHADDKITMVLLYKLLGPTLSTKLFLKEYNHCAKIAMLINHLKTAAPKEIDLREYKRRYLADAIVQCLLHHPGINNALIYNTVLMGLSGIYCNHDPETGEKLLQTLCVIGLEGVINYINLILQSTHAAAPVFIYSEDALEGTTMTLIHDVVPGLSITLNNQNILKLLTDLLSYVDYDLHIYQTLMTLIFSKTRHRTIEAHLRMINHEFQNNKLTYTNSRGILHFTYIGESEYLKNIFKTAVYNISEDLDDTQDTYAEINQLANNEDVILNAAAMDTLELDEGINFILEDSITYPTTGDKSAKSPYAKRLGM
uniref:Uncharacterized protein n=1 Tax=Ranid herpesvirus 4 TaxID=2849006 RepID=A0A8F3HTJ7_9VIRU|nr:MAG: hypothetical protein [Ranid herpesvirus 4]